LRQIKNPPNRKNMGQIAKKYYSCSCGFVKTLARIFSACCTIISSKPLFSKTPLVVIKMQPKPTLIPLFSTTNKGIRK